MTAGWSPGRLDFVPWRLMLVGSHRGTSFTSPCWRREFWDGFQVFFSNVCAPAVRVLVDVLLSDTVDFSTVLLIWEFPDWNLDSQKGCFVGDLSYCCSFPRDKFWSCTLNYAKAASFPCCQNNLSLIQGCTNAMQQVVVAITFRTAAPCICGRTVWSLLSVIFLAPRILRWRLGF